MECYEDQHSRGRAVRIVITRWGLDAYLDLLHEGVFDRGLYREVLRPDILRLRNLGSDDKFENAKFWGPANDRRGRQVPDGFKMKWHNLGPRNVQLRLFVALLDGDAFLCRAYVKTGDAQDKRMAAILKHHILLIRQGRLDERGEL